MRTNDRGFKGIIKLSDRLLVPCKMTDCIFHEGSPRGKPDKCYCSHPHKGHYNTFAACPLYQFDWLKRAAAKAKDEG